MQAIVEKAISTITGEDVTLAGAGRTDAGAHALRQVVAFSTHSTLPVDVFCRALNATLPRDVAVTDVREVDLDFHPRICAVSRTYRYVLWNRAERSPFYEGRAEHVKLPLDEEKMHAALQALVGSHDMSAFIPRRHTGNRERHVYRGSCWREGNVVLIEMQANGFMRQMVRAIVGTLIRVGLGKMSPIEFATILQARDRSHDGVSAPACGLYLVDVGYVSQQEFNVDNPDSNCISFDADTPAASEEIL